jgi:lipoprotein NlpI
MKILGSVVFCLFVGSLFAQVDPGMTVHRLRVRVEFANGICDHSTRVRLMSVEGPITESSPNDQCEVDFANVPVGTYHVNVSGMSFAPVDDIISASSGAPDVEVKVKRTNEPEGTGSGPANAFVSATDLAIPAKAQKEFDKAQGLIDHHEFNKAIQALHGAIAIYPSYAGAYNNLGVVYSRMGDHDKEREALQRAISINEHFAPAYVNLGRMEITLGDFPAAEGLLNKATSYDPTDAMTLVLLTYSEFMDKNFDLAIASAHRAHTLQGTHAFAHEVAARAYEQKHDGTDAIAELELFLKEEPTGQRADSARKELAQLHAIVQKSAVRTQ